MSAYQQYIDKLSKYFQAQKATEHTYRPVIVNYLETLIPDCAVTNEPKRQACGAPDIIITNKINIPIGYLETKPVGDDLDAKKYHEQFLRYRKALNLVVVTDYLSFRFYRDSELLETVVIGAVEQGKVVAVEQGKARFEYLIKNLDTPAYKGISITSSEDLARRMADKALLFREVLNNALSSHDRHFELATGSLHSQFNAFKKTLLPDLTHTEFADLYAQTVAFGLFAARFHDKTLYNFSREEAARLVPKSNPFLRKLFQYIASNDIDERIVWIIDDLVATFLATDVKSLLADFGTKTQKQDPVLHFYETFLAAYDPDLRKARGVWYTPQPVVNFIIRAVDDLLKQQFDIKKGLADNTKTTDNEQHLVQLLDPACGTGTFLAETFAHIQQQFAHQKGIWNNYVAQDLVPRMYGFELLMASYAMAHIKLDYILNENGFEANKYQRLNIYLTNALEPHDKDENLLLAEWLSDEANAANRIKRSAPIMVVMGNPPYSGHSSNNNIAFIDQLMDDYKKEPAGGKLKEKNPKWLNDDYVKFIRFGQYHIQKNGTGILAYINPHGFLDNPTFRGMRWQLLQAFDAIYIIDLHGNAKKKETAPDGTADQNVFDIMQGVSINLFVKTGKKPKDTLAQVWHYDLYGKRDHKYQYLTENKLASIPFQPIALQAPQYFFVPKDFDSKAEYDKGVPLNELFPTNSVGIVTARDAILVNGNRTDLLRNVKAYYAIDAEKDKVQKISYRPFDERYVYYDTKLVERSREKVMQHFLKGENVGLVGIRRSRNSEEFREIFVTNKITTGATTISLLDINYTYPLYLYSSDLLGVRRVPNISPAIAEAWAADLGLVYVSEKVAGMEATQLAPIDILDYVYAVLHTPSYRETYKEFLKIDFPRVPYPTHADSFWAKVRIGSELRKVHLFTADLAIEVDYPQSGTNIVEKIHYDGEQVYINKTQYFGKVPPVAWAFYIGGYQPAQKWLKDRKGRELSYDDITHYQRIIAALVRTEELMTRYL